MLIKKEKYWVRIGSSKKNSLDERGMWVIYTKTERDLEELIETISIFLCKYDLIGSSVRVRPSSIFTIETTIDRFEILKTKKLIKSYFAEIIRDMHWKASFESIDDWNNDNFPKGDLWYLGRMEILMERTFDLIRSNRIEKASKMHREILKLGSEMRHSQLIKKINKRKKMIVKPVFNNINYNINPNQVFLIMPFNEEWSNTTYSILKDSVEENGLELIRADEIFSPGSIIQDIWKLINESGLVIADISVHNPNVFYELGIAHTIGKKVLMIKKEGSEKSPFDIGFWRYFEYETNYDKAKDFKLALKKILINYKKSYVNTISNQ